MEERYIVAGIVQKRDQVILGKKAKDRPPYPNVWHTPGGGVEDKEKAKQLFDQQDFDDGYFHQELQRELKEELGIEVANIRCIVPTYRATPREAETENKDGQLTHYYFLEYLCDYESGSLQPADDLAEAKWVNKSELSSIELTPPSREMYRELGWVK